MFKQRLSLSPYIRLFRSLSFPAPDSFVWVWLLSPTIAFAIVSLLMGWQVTVVLLKFIAPLWLAVIMWHNYKQIRATLLGSNEEDTRRKRNYDAPALQGRRLSSLLRK